MNKELLQSISELMLKLGFIVKVQFMKPLREFERERSEFPPGYIHVLGWLKSNDGPVSMSDLAYASFVSKPNLTTMIDRLCADGLVERSRDISDRRIVNVALTSKGLDFLRRHKEDVAKFIESRVSLLDREDLEKLKNTLEDLAVILQGIQEKQAASDEE